MRSAILPALLCFLLVACTPGNRVRNEDGNGKSCEPAAETVPPPPPRASATPIAKRSAFATARDGTRLYYEVAGSGPAVVFVHGLGGNHAVWFQQVADFAIDHTVVTLSQRGFAPSGGDGRHYAVDVLVSDLEAVLDAAGVSSAAVVGQSMGGWTALGLALRSPARVSALVLADTFAGIGDDEISAHLREVAASASRLSATPPPLGVHPALAAEFSRNHPDLAVLYQDLASFGAPKAATIASQLLPVRVAASRLGSLRAPTLFVVGSEDRLFPPALVRKAASAVAGSQVRVVDGAGHSPYFEKPAEWNRIVRDFLGAR